MSIPSPSNGRQPAEKTYRHLFGFENKFQAHERLFSSLRYCNAGYSPFSVR
jgi:hypothetical protein